MFAYFRNASGGLKFLGELDVSILYGDQAKFDCHGEVIIVSIRTLHLPTPLPILMFNSEQDFLKVKQRLALISQ